MRLRQKRTALQAPVFALTHDALHVLVRDLQVLQQHPFKLGRAVRVLGHFGGQIEIAFFCDKYVVLNTYADTAVFRRGRFVVRRNVQTRLNR